MGDRAAKEALFDGFADIAKAMSNGRRAELIDVLAQGERHVEELAAEIGQSMANTSFHLRTLANGGLVTTPRGETPPQYPSPINNLPSPTTTLCRSRVCPGHLKKKTRKIADR